LLLLVEPSKNHTRNTCFHFPKCVCSFSFVSVFFYLFICLFVSRGSGVAQQ